MSENIDGVTRISLPPTRLKFGYTNWQSCHSVKHVETRFMSFGTLEKFYPGSPAQWYIIAVDLEKNEERSYQMGRMECPEALT
jgi:hypothetical protein